MAAVPYLARYVATLHCLLPSTESKKRRMVAMTRQYNMCVLTSLIGSLNWSYKVPAKIGTHKKTVLNQEQKYHIELDQEKQEI